MMWEIFGLKIINSLYLSEYIKKEEITDVEFTQIINQVLGRLFEDIDILKDCPEANFSEFGTRRSMSTNFQRLINEILAEKLPGQYVGTSNVLIAKELGSANPKGTNAHEIFKWAKDNHGKSAIPKWNFHKILINKEGKIEDTFNSFVTPMSGKIINKIESVL